MEYGFSMRGQYPAGTDMQDAFAKACEVARLADKLGYSYLTKGQHYSMSPVQALQQTPFLARIMVEAPNIRLVTGIVLLPLHKPLDIAEQLAAIDVMSGGRLIFGSGIGYREVEFKAFGMTSKERGRRFEENLIAIRRLWTEEKVDIVLAPSHTSLRSLQTVISSDNLKIKLSSQDISQYSEGAYTGEVSNLQLEKLNITYSIIGHSERREYFNENNER